MRRALRPSALVSRLCLALVLFLPVAAPSYAATGSKTTYLDFEPGKNVAKVEETMEIDSIGMAKKPFWYLVRGLTGQTLTLRLKGEAGTRVLVSCPGARNYAVVTEPSWTFELPDSGDYLLRLEAEGAKEKTSFPVALEVELSRTRKTVAPSASGSYGRDGGEEAVIDVAQEADGSIRFYLYAFWKGGVLPEIAGRVPLEKNLATYKDGECAMTFQFNGDRLEVKGEGTCPSGSQEAIFGTYQRSTPCGWPRTATK